MDLLDSPEAIDMSLWTKSVQGAYIPSKNKPIFKQEVIPRSSSSSSETPVPDERTSSPESETSSGSIPYRTIAQTDNGTNNILDYLPDAADTVTVRAEDSTSGYRGTTRYRPQEIKLWEGDESLRKLPTSIRQQLEDACRIQRTELLDCTKSSWDSSTTLFRTAAGRKARFVDPSTGNELAAARYRYGPDNQIVVVRLPEGTTVNGRDAAVINFYRPDQQKCIKGRRDVLIHVWNIWDPTRPDGSAGYVLRELTRINRNMSDNSRSVSTENPQPSSNRQSVNRAGRSLQESSKQAQKAANSAKRLMARSPAPRSSRVNLENTSDSDEKTPFKRTKTTHGQGTLGPVQDPVTGYITTKRASDGVMVRLSCPKCDRHDFVALQALFNHCRNGHDIHLRNHKEAIEVCGVPLQTANTKTRQTNNVPKSHTWPRRTGSSSESDDLHTTLVPKPAPPPQEVESVFIFKHGPDDLSPRIRSSKICNSAKMLFAHALAAGVARKDTLMLTVQIGDNKPLHVVRGDVEDFEMIMLAVADAQDQDEAQTEIVVTAEDFDV